MEPSVLILTLPLAELTHEFLRGPEPNPPVELLLVGAVTALDFAIAFRAAAAGALTLAASVGAREPLRLLFLEPMTEEENQARKQAAHQQIVEAVQRQGFWWPGE